MNWQCRKCDKKLDNHTQYSNHRCKRCFNCHLYIQENEFSSHTDIVKCKKCKKSFHVKLGMYLNHQCYRCRGCHKYESWQHQCKHTCELCGIITICSHDQGHVCQNSDKGIFILRKKIQIMEADIKETKEFVKEILDILKFGPLSQAFIEIKTDFEETIFQ